MVDGSEVETLTVGSMVDGSEVETLTVGSMVDGSEVETLTIGSMVDGREVELKKSTCNISYQVLGKGMHGQRAGAS